MPTHGNNPESQRQDTVLLLRIEKMKRPGKPMFTWENNTTFISFKTVV